jgi:3-oxoacyl-[acyl-carrier protein] reductase
MRTLPRMDLGIEGRVALVTGASKGIGRAIAAELAAEGARVAVSSRSHERIEATAAEIGATAFVHDTADLDAVPGLVDSVERELGPVEILVANSGGPPMGPDPLGFTREQWEAAYRELVLGTMALVERVMPGMRERGFGRIVSVASTSVREPIPVLMLSNSHRSALLAAFKTIARNVAGDGVTVNTVLPGRIATDRALAPFGGSREAAEEAARQVVPAGRLGTVEEMAAAAAFLCSARASYVTGAALAVDGGMLQSI